MRNNPAFLNGSFTATDIFKNRQFFVQPLKRFYIDHIGRRPAVLGNKDGVSVPGHGGNDVRSFAFQCRDQFSFHK